MSLPGFLHPLFHNYEPEAIDPDRHAGLVIRTVLAAGTWEQVLWLFRRYGKERVREVFLKDCRGLRTLPEPTRRLWSLVFLGSTHACEGNEDYHAHWQWRRGVR